MYILTHKPIIQCNIWLTYQGISQRPWRCNYVAIVTQSVFWEVRCQSTPLRKGAFINRICRNMDSNRAIMFSKVNMIYICCKKLHINLSMHVRACRVFLGPLSLTWLNFNMSVAVWSQPSKMLGEITYPIYVCTVEVGNGYEISSPYLWWM